MLEKTNVVVQTRRTKAKDQRKGGECRGVGEELASIRASIDKVNVIINMVGELIIT